MLNSYNKKDFVELSSSHIGSGSASLKFVINYLGSSNCKDTIIMKSYGGFGTFGISGLAKSRIKSGDKVLIVTHGGMIWNIAKELDIHTRPIPIRGDSVVLTTYPKLLSTKKKEEYDLVIFDNCNFAPSKMLSSITSGNFAKKRILIRVASSDSEIGVYTK